MKKILTPRERLEVPRKILSPIALWKVIAEKRTALDKKRRELGLESGRSLGKKIPGEPRKLKGHVVRDDAATGKGEEQAEESLGKISSLDIMNSIETEIWEEERVVRGALKKTAEFLAGRQVMPLQCKPYRLIRPADSRLKKQQSRPTTLDDSRTTISGYRGGSRGMECRNHLSPL